MPVVSLVYLSSSPRKNQRTRKLTCPCFSAKEVILLTRWTLLRGSNGRCSFCTIIQTLSMRSERASNLISRSSHKRFKTTSCSIECSRSNVIETKSGSQPSQMKIEKMLESSASPLLSASTLKDTRKAMKRKLQAASTTI